MAKRGRPKKEGTVPRITAKDVLMQLEKHEAQCAIELREIARRLDSGKETFRFLQMQIWGLYALIIGVGVIDKLV
jgi:hypothetical protein